MNIVLVGAEREESLALRYIRASLEQCGHSVVQVTFNGADETEAAARLVTHANAELAGFSMVFTYRAAEFAILARRCRELGYRGHLVAGGHFAALNARSLLTDESAFDSVALGEGEHLMTDLASRLKSLASVPGLVWRHSDGTIHQNPPATKPADLDVLPWPVRRDPPDTFLGLPIANMLASRGCTHHCDFCSIVAWHRFCGGPRLRLRKPDAVATEMAELYRRGYRIFNFHDDNFFLPDRRANLRRFWQLRGALDKHGVGRIAFAVKSRPDTVDPEVFAFLKEFGLFRVFIGIEAGTPEALRQLGRTQSLDQNARALETVQHLDLHACFNLLMLNPDSTLEDFRDQIAFLRAHPRNPMNFCRTEVYAGTPLEARLMRDGRLLGSYWGHDYRIADERAHRVFELLRVAFNGRSFGAESIHHMVMKVDYELQLLNHFWDGPTSLRHRAKTFVRRVNQNSCDHLEKLADAAGSTPVRPVEEIAAHLADAIATDNSQFRREAVALLREIRRASQPSRSRFAWQQEAAALIVSSLSVLSASEASAQNATNAPTTSIQTNAVQTAAALKQLKSELGQAFPRQLLADLGAAKDVEVTLQVDVKGKITLVQVPGVTLANRGSQTSADGSAERPMHVQTAARFVQITSRDLRGKRWTLRYTAEELASAGKETHLKSGKVRVELEPPYMCEMVATPPSSDPSPGPWKFRRW